MIGGARPARAAEHPPTTVIGPVEAQAARTPAAPALVLAGGSVVTYGELNAAANRLARALAARGARPGTVVGLGRLRPVDQLTALLAVAKSGAAFLTPEPGELGDLEEPRDAGVRAAATPLLVLEEDDLAVAGGLATDPPRALTPQHPLCVAPGPGSRPSAARLTHGEADRRVRELQAAYRLGPDDRVLQTGLPTWAYFWPLRTGAAIVLADG
ncbi:AMP-binding protein [Kitasatospora sp. NPDC059408]|uniref:AMP-binding protein n=1 Tax=Kitasatospora sp. NPDC059408 TaxID=3346823 RepID=UPI0036AABD38